VSEPAKPRLALMMGDPTGIGPELVVQGLADPRVRATMYHDQGQIALKLLGFERGVTVGGGLPVVLTTPAHGTAHEIAGRGVADPGAFIRAVEVASRLARGRAARGA